MTTPLAKAFYDKGKVVLVQPLGSTLRLGSIGYFADEQWVEVGTTKSFFGLTLTSNPGSGSPNSFDGKGGKHFSFDVKGKGVVSPLVPQIADAKLRAEVTFGSEGAFVMSVRNQRVRTAQELGELMAAIRWAYHFRGSLPEGRRWEKRYAVIVGIATADSVTAVSSMSSNAAIVVQASGKLPAPSTPAELDAKMKITREKESTDKLWRGPASGYAVQALKLDPSIWKKWDREDLIHVKSAALAVRVPSRPASYEAWARSQPLSDPTRARTALSTPSGRAGATRGTATAVTKQVRAKRATKSAKKVPRR